MRDTKQSERQPTDDPGENGVSRVWAGSVYREETRASMEPNGLDFELLVRYLQQARGLDLNQYKPNYLRRRIGVRMRARGCPDYRSYLQVLRQQPDEFSLLINDLTINVTEFFRDEDVFEELRKEVIPILIKERRETGILSLRMWSAGCATGEEPYSLAILVHETLSHEAQRRDWNVRILASDLDEGALARARRALYERVKLLEGMKLDDYFVKTGDSYQVKEEIARMVKFVRHDVAFPPPLRHFDLILCRNVLIYFEKERQRKILERFCEVLRKGGMLVLGKSEAILFGEGLPLVPYQRRLRIYRRT